MGETFLLLILPLPCPDSSPLYYYDRNIILEVKNSINLRGHIARTHNARLICDINNSVQFIIPARVYEYEFATFNYVRAKLALVNETRYSPECAIVITEETTRVRAVN